MQPQLRKACPRCQTPTGLKASCCLYCGHQFRTLFVPPLPASEAVHPTRKLYVLAPAIKDRSVRQAAVCLAAILVLSSMIGLASPSLPDRAAAFSRTDKVRKEKPSRPLPPVIVIKAAITYR